MCYGILLFLVGHIASAIQDGALVFEKLFPRSQEVFFWGVLLALPGIVPLFFYAEYLAWGWLVFWLILGIWWSVDKTKYL